MGNNYLVPDVSSWGGVKHWGTGAASLVNTSIQQGKTIEQINEELSAYTRGEGFDNGMTDGLIMMGVAPAAISLTPLLAQTPAIVGTTKVYGILAGKSVIGGVTTSAALNQEYKAANALYDISIGVLMDKGIALGVKSVGSNSLPGFYFNAKGKLTNYTLGSGVSSAVVFWTRSITSLGNE